MIEEANKEQRPGQTLDQRQLLHLGDKPGQASPLIGRWSLITCFRLRQTVDHAPDTLSPTNALSSSPAGEEGPLRDAHSDESLRQHHNEGHRPGRRRPLPHLRRLHPVRFAPADHLPREAAQMTGVGLPWPAAETAALLLLLRCCRGRPSSSDGADSARALRRRHRRHGEDAAGEGVADAEQEDCRQNGGGRSHKVSAATHPSAGARVAGACSEVRRGSRPLPPSF